MSPVMGVLFVPPRKIGKLRTGLVPVLPSRIDALPRLTNTCAGVIGANTAAATSAMARIACFEPSVADARAEIRRGA
jgi:hypothetical protein